MNGRKSLRTRAAVVGLALLMGSSLLGCHAGPRFFAKKDRDERTAKKEFADKGKFINKKKIRPESEYLQEDDLKDERVAKNESKSKSKSKATNSSRSRMAEEFDRSVAARNRTDDSTDQKSRTGKPSATQQQASKSVPKSDVARRDSARRPSGNDFTDSLFDDPPPEKKTIVRPAVKAPVVAKKNAADEDPFKNEVASSFANKRVTNKVATVNFNNLEDDDDETDENDEELDEIQLPARGMKNVNITTKPAGQPAAGTSGQLKRKFLPEDELDEVRSTATAARKQTQRTEESVRHQSQRTGNAASNTRREADSSVTGNRQQVQKTLNDWRRELDQAESSDPSDSVASAEEQLTKHTPVRQSRFEKSGHLGEASIDEFSSTKKAQGAIFNGDLIIDTSSTPTRFQRNSGSDPQGQEAGTGRGGATDSNGRTRPNSGASIDIVPGATQNRSRSSGQITLQSFAEQDEQTSPVERAVYEQSSSENGLGQLPSLSASGNESSEASMDETTLTTKGPRLMPLDGDAEIMSSETAEVPAPPLEWSSNASVKEGRGWPAILLAIGGLASAALIGLGLRRRKELVQVPVRVQKPEPLRTDSPYDPTSWPRG